MSRYQALQGLLPRHLGGTKYHPLQARPNEWYEQHERERDAARAAQSARIRARNDEKRARRYARMDELRAWDREDEVARQKLADQLALQDAELAGRLQLQGGDIESRYGLQAMEGAQRLQQGDQRFGQQLALGQQGFGHDLAILDERLGGQIDLANLAADLQADRDERLNGYQLAGKEFDVLAQEERDVRQGVIQNWLGDELYGRMSDRDKELAGLNLNLAKIQEGWDTIREFRKEGFQQQRDQSNHDFAKEMLGLNADWEMKAMSAQANLERQGILTDQFFSMRYAEMAKGQEKVRRGITMLSDEDQNELRSLRSAYSKELRNNSHDALQKSQAIGEIVNRMASIYDTAQPMPAEMRAEKREEALKSVFGDAWDSVSHLPWVQTPEGDTQLPRGYQPPDPDAPQKAAAEHRKVQLDEYNKGVENYMKQMKAREDFIEAHTDMKELGQDKDGYPIEKEAYYDERGAQITRWGLQELAEQRFPAELPVHPDAQQEVSAGQPGLLQGIQQLLQSAFGGQAQPSQQSPAAVPVEPDQGAIDALPSEHTGVPPEVEEAYRVMKLPEYMGSWAGVQGQATPKMRKEAQAVIDKWEQEGTTDTLEKRKGNRKNWLETLPQPKSREELEKMVPVGGWYMAPNGVPTQRRS